MRKSAKYWIKKLELTKHPEGGYYKEIYRADEVIKNEHLPSRFKDDRNYSTAIYFLLDGNDFSAFHFDDFEPGNRKNLIRQYPEHNSLIIELTRNHKITQ